MYYDGEMCHLVLVAAEQIWTHTRIGVATIHRELIQGNSDHSVHPCSEAGSVIIHLRLPPPVDGQQLERPSEHQLHRRPTQGTLAAYDLVVLS
jgi:hypothetical protein